MRRRAFVTGISAATLAPRVARAQTALPKIRVGAILTQGYAEAWYALDMGFFKDAGLDVDISIFHNGGDVSAALVGGAIDVGISSAISLANAAIRGIPFVYIAAGNIYVSERPTVALCVPKDSAIKSARDFNNTTITNSGLKDQLHLSAVVWLATHGADVESVKVIETPGSGMLAILSRGSISGAVIAEPFLSAAVAGGARIIAKCMDSIAPRSLFGGWFATTQWANQNTALARKFATAMYRTARWANGDPPQALSILQKYLKVDEAVLRKTTPSTFAETLDPNLIEPQLRLAAIYKFIDRPVPARQLIAML
jgi:NitT/TauT family transport system substrate-binding protein